MPIIFAGHVNGQGVLTNVEGNVSVREFEEARGYCELQFSEHIDDAVMVATARAEHADFAQTQIAIGRGYDGPSEPDERIAVVRFEPRASSSQGFDFIVFRP